MNAIDKLGVMIFVLAFLLSIFDSVFVLIPLIESVKLVLLILFGLIAGLININENEEIKALLASIGFLVGQMFISGRFALDIYLQGFAIVLDNLTIFISMFAIGLGIKLIIDLNASSLDTLSGNIRDSKWWNIVILFSIAVAFIAFVMETFFVSGNQQIFTLINYLLSIIFIADVIVLYKNYNHDKSSFFRDSWLDIIAAIPLGLLFSTLKLLKISRVVKVILKFHPNRIVSVGIGGKILSKHTMKEK